MSGGDDFFGRPGGGGRLGLFLLPLPTYAHLGILFPRASLPRQKRENNGWKYGVLQWGWGGKVKTEKKDGEEKVEEKKSKFLSCRNIRLYTSKIFQYDFFTRRFHLMRIKMFFLSSLITAFSYGGGRSIAYEYDT